MRASQYLKKQAEAAILPSERLRQWTAARFAGRRQVAVLGLNGALSDPSLRTEDKLKFFLGLAGNPERVDVGRTTPADLLRFQSILIFGSSTLPWQRTLLASQVGCFHVDPLSHPREGWDWWNFVKMNAPERVSVSDSRRCITGMLSDLQKSPRDRVYVFGTGPSLARALERDWSDGYRVACNTIVRDPELWNHLRPHVLAAADPIYHFGICDYPTAFRNDLFRRMEEHPAYFVYPARYEAMVQTWPARLKPWMVPVHFGFHEDPFTSLARYWRLPHGTGNVLQCLLLPIAASLSRDLRVFGFDGRAPQDKGFWANSSRHSYTELIPELRMVHPSFFKSNVPTADPAVYHRRVHGDILEQQLAGAEAKGFKIVSLHHSYTPALEKRFDPKSG